jgi:predicted nucleotidyltransferase
MVKKEKIIALLQENRSFLDTVYGVKKIGVFGSYAKGHPDETSDIDVFVEFEHPIGFRFIEFAEYLERLLGRKVDVLTSAGIQGIRIARIAKDIEKSIVYFLNPCDMEHRP